MGDPAINSETTDLEDLVTRAKSGDESSYGLLIDHTQDRLFRFCFYLAADEQLAHDLAQDTLIRVLERIGSLKETRRYISWVFQIARNLFIDYQRSPRSQAHSELQESTYGAEIPTDDRSLQVREVLQKLDAEERMVLILVDLEGYSYAEAAEVVGITENALRSRLHRARKSFVRRYEKA